MCDKGEFEVCRLCLNSCGLLMNVFGENSKLQFMLEKTIEDLIDVKVVKDTTYPWLVCSTCMEKLTEFRLFKRRCSECLSVFYDRIQKWSNPATKDWITNREEFPGEMKKEIDDDEIASDAVDGSGVDVRDDMIVAKEKIDTASGCSVAPEKDVGLPKIASMQEGDSHWSGSVEARIIDPLEDGELHLSLNEEVVIKEEWDVDIPQEEGCLGADLLQEQGGGKGQVCVANILHTCQICNKGFAQKDMLEAHVMHVHTVKAEEIRCNVDAEAFECTSDVEADSMTFKCAICTRAFLRRNTLNRHMLTHSDERPYKCDICLKGFNHKHTLEGHRLTHSGARPHRCEMCAKTFTLKQHLKDHIRMHTGENLYKCEVCLKTFIRKPNLKLHMYIHTGERPHKCVICSRSFRQKHHLKDHMSQHRDRLNK